MQASVLLLHWGSYCWAFNLWVLIIYLFFLPVMLPSVLQGLPQTRQWECFLVFGNFSLFKTPFSGQDSLPMMELPPHLLCLFFFVFYIFPTCFWRQWSAFLGAWCPLPAFRSCFVEFTQRWNVLLMNLWGRKWFPRLIPLPSSEHSNSLFFNVKHKPTLIVI